MKKFWLLAFFLMIFFSLKAQVYAQSLPPTDKAAHFAVSSLGVASSLKFSEWLHPQNKVTPAARFFASTFLLSLGLAKELNDAKNNRSGLDAGDMVANVTGIVYGNFLMIEF